MGQDEKRLRMLQIARERREGRGRVLLSLITTKPIQKKRRDGMVHKCLPVKLIVPVSRELKGKIVNIAEKHEMTQAECCFVVLLEIIERPKLLRAAITNYPARLEALQRRFQESEMLRRGANKTEASEQPATENRKSSTED